MMDHIRLSVIASTDKTYHKKLIRRWDKLTFFANCNYRLNDAIVVKLRHHARLLNFPVTFAYLISESRLFRRIMIFLIIAFYTCKYLDSLTYRSVSCL